MEKILLPCLVLNDWHVHFYIESHPNSDIHPNKHLNLSIPVQSGILPMDLHNSLSKQFPDMKLLNDYQWITTTGRIISQERAFKFALNHGYIDAITSNPHGKLTILDSYTGSWRRSPTKGKIKR